MQRILSVVSRATLSLFIFLTLFSAFTVHAQTTAQDVVTVTAQVGGGNGNGPGGSGGSGGQQIRPDTTVRFRGFAYPSRPVTLLRNNRVVATTVAGSYSSFELVLTGLTEGVQTFSLYSEDVEGVFSRPVSVTVMVNKSAITTISDIIIPPTLNVSARAIRQGDSITLSGQSAPGAEIYITLINQGLTYSTIANSDGLFDYTLETTALENGRVYITAQASVFGELSQLSTPIELSVQKGVQEGEAGWILKGDVNKDNRVNLVDLTIIKSWYGRPLTATMRALENERLSGDSVIDLTDFSIAAYYWTG